MTGIQFQSKPEGDHYITIRKSYKDITDGTASTAALLSVFEYLAEKSLAPSWKPGNVLPDVIEISGNCNTPLLIHLLDGLLKPAAIKNKISVLKGKEFITTETTSGSNRKVFYNRKAIADALVEWGKNERLKNHQPKSDRSKNSYQGLKNSRSPGSESISANPCSENDSRATSQKVTGQKIATTNHITNLSSNQGGEEEKTAPSFTGSAPQQTGQRQEPAQRHSGESSAAAIPAYGHFGQYQGSKVFLEERPWVDQWRNVNPTYNDGFMKWCTPKLEKFDSYKAGANIADVKRYLAKGNYDTPESNERANGIAAWWEEYQAGVEAEATKVKYLPGSSPFDLLGRAG